MSESNRDPRLDPRKGDKIEQPGKRYRVLERGVAGSVRFIRSYGRHSLQGQKSLPCWQRLAKGATVLHRA